LVAATKTSVVTLLIGSIILGAIVGIGHALWSRSAESEVVHYSWPVKWALTFAAESPDLPAGSRFATASVAAAEGERWTVAGEVELPSSEGRRLITTYTADVRSRCANFSERRCWEMAGLTFGSVPAATAAPAAERLDSERDASMQLAALPLTEEPTTLADAPQPTPQSAAEAEEDLDFVLGEPLIEPADALIEALGGWSTIRSSSSTAPRYDPVLVRDIQRGLAALGYEPGPADGVPGRRTHAAAEAFRKQEKLAKAALDFDLLDAINRRLETRHAAPAPAASEDDDAQPANAPRPNWMCAGINPKHRDCGG
jgi:hypothetical protein